MNHSKQVRMIELAILTSIILFLESTGLGMFKTFGLEFTILQVPVIIGAVVIGPSAGAALGAVFGFVSFWECFGKSPFGASLLAINPFLTFLVCVPTRILMGWCCGLIFRGMEKLLKEKNSLVQYVAASLSGALLNTVFFMSMLCLCFYRTDFIQGLAVKLETNNVLTFVILFVGVQGLVEALVCATLGTFISKGVRHALHKKSL